MLIYLVSVGFVCIIVGCFCVILCIFGDEFSVTVTMYLPCFCPGQFFYEFDDQMLNFNVTSSAALIV